MLQVMALLLRPDLWPAAAVNLKDVLLRGRLADTSPLPSTVIATGPQLTLHRYDRPSPGTHRLPVLLVPPLAAPAVCFDLRRGCSVAEHLLEQGHPVYLVDYGEIAFGDRRLGIEHWVNDVLPTAIRAVSGDADGRPVQLVGWSLGGVFSMLVTADDKTLPVASVAAIGSPIDFTQVPLVAPIRPLAALTGGRLLTGVYRALGSAPAPIVQKAFQATGLTSYLTRPLAIASNITDREFLAQIEAVDVFMGQMLAYPGRTFGQLYHRLFRANDLLDGRLDLDGREIDLTTIGVPLLSVAGTGDGIAPVGCVHHIGNLVPHAELRTAPGGHLGVLTGRAARTTTWAVLDEFLAANGRAG
jgi:polyhydroxyalkanoate synthase